MDTRNVHLFPALVLWLLESILMLKKCIFVRLQGQILRLALLFWGVLCVLMECTGLWRNLALEWRWDLTTLLS
jgi:hypothetical protein